LARRWRRQDGNVVGLKVACTAYCPSVIDRLVLQPHSSPCQCSLPSISLPELRLIPVIRDSKSQDACARNNSLGGTAAARCLVPGRDFGLQIMMPGHIVLRSRTPPTPAVLTVGSLDLPYGIRSTSNSLAYLQQLTLDMLFWEVRPYVRSIDEAGNEPMDMAVGSEVRTPGGNASSVGCRLGPAPVAARTLCDGCQTNGSLR